MVETPVLYITFARPEYASQSFAAIKKAQPKKLYFYSNKARTDRPDEVARNEEVRSYIKQIDWECEVKTWFRDEYVDVFTSLWGAIDWVFDNEEKAIIIEEDVVASLAFFDYVDKLIDKYRDNDKIWLISGNNALPDESPKGLSYFPSRWADIYGWASWRRRWKSVDWQLSNLPKYNGSKEMRQYWGNWPMFFYMKLFYKRFFKRFTISNYNPWDSIFLLSMRIDNGYCLTPCTNLCQDIGVNGANHSQGFYSPLSIVSIDEDKFTIKKEPTVIIPSEYDKMVFYKYRLLGVIRRKLRAFF